jgi:hypothetical protein
MASLFPRCLPALVLSLLAAVFARADVLFDNGPFITDPTGGTGSIAGLPISQAEGFTLPGSSYVYSTTGISATYADNAAVAEDFVVPAGGWDLDSVTLFAFQTSQTTPTIETIRINLWTAAPYSAGSPPPVPDPLPQPMMAEPLVLEAGPGAFVCHRESVSGTSTVRPVYAYTVSLDGLPNGGVLEPGEYWLEWSMIGAETPTPRCWIPLVTPRAEAFNTNARLFNSIDGTPSGPREWFEGREGYFPPESEGWPYALPFILSGTVPEPATLTTLAAGMALVVLRRAAERR